MRRAWIQIKRLLKHKVSPFVIGLLIGLMIAPLFVRSQTLNEAPVLIHNADKNAIALEAIPVIVKESASADLILETQTAVPAGAVSVYQEGYRSLVEETFGTSSPGVVLMGGGGGNYIGIFQIGRAWIPTAQKMGLDVFTPEGNVAFAKYLLDTYGLGQWECASMI